jgi:protein-S-isoprenylcysteine O-methyltransferase Ste14
MLFAIAYVAFAQPSAIGLVVGAMLVALGQSLRLWASGCLQRNVKLACSGPYSYVRHPLYLGSLVMGIGLAIAVQGPQWWLLAFLALYVAFYGPAMHVEELRLQSLFGTEYQEYMTDVGRLWPRFAHAARWAQAHPGNEFSWRRALDNKELRSAAAMAALLIVQVIKLL